MAGNRSLRISPRPGVAIQKARALSVMRAHSGALRRALQSHRVRSPGSSTAEMRATGCWTDEKTRMVDPSWRIPDAPLRISFAATNAVALVALLCTASALRAVLPLSGLYPWKAGAVFVSMLLLATGFVGAHHPFARFGPANQTTTLRAVLVALVASFARRAPGSRESRPRRPASRWRSLCSMVLDGWLARRSRMASDFGARFDMEVDALLVMVLSILAWQFGKAGPWVLRVGTLAIWLSRRRVAAAVARAPVDAEPSPSGDLRRSDRRTEPGHRPGRARAGKRPVVCDRADARWCIRSRPISPGSGDSQV